MREAGSEHGYHEAALHGLHRSQSSETLSCSNQGISGKAARVHVHVCMNRLGSGT